MPVKTGPIPGIGVVVDRVSLADQLIQIMDLIFTAYISIGHIGSKHTNETVKVICRNSFSHEGPM